MCLHTWATADSFPGDADSASTAFSAATIALATIALATLSSNTSRSILGLTMDASTDSAPA